VQPNRGVIAKRLRIGEKSGLIYGKRNFLQRAGTFFPLGDFDS
jgi:hypothetical protein